MTQVDEKATPEHRLLLIVAIANIIQPVEQFGLRRVTSW